MKMHQHAPRPLVQQLQRQIRRLETASRRLGSELVSSGCPGIDQLLPEQGFARGTLVEWFSTEVGSGAGSLSLLSARAACQNGGALVIVDPAQRFYPPAAAAWGINLDNLIILQSPSKQQLYWATDQALRCSSVAAVWGWFDGIGERWFRRFQLAAEESGCIGLFLRAEHLQQRPSWSEVQLLVGRIQNSKFKIQNEEMTKNKERSGQSSASNSGHGDLQPLGSGSPLSAIRFHSSSSRHLQVRLLRSPGGCSGVVHLEIDSMTGVVREVRHQDEARPLPVAAKLAHPKTCRRSARA